ncbi:hypothetical protein GGP41_002022, partial [Bipolaris sorokiniana]
EEQRPGWERKQADAKRRLQVKRNKSRRWSRSGTLLVYRLVGDTAGALGPRHHIPGRASVAGRQLEGAIGTGEGGARLGRPARVLDSKTNVVQGRWGVSAPTRYYHLILTIARATSRPLHVYFGRRPPAVAWLESCTPHARWYWPSPSLVPPPFTAHGNGHNSRDKPTHVMRTMDGTVT